jgi:hypothetical protein
MDVSFSLRDIPILKEFIRTNYDLDINDFLDCFSTFMLNIDFLLNDFNNPKFFFSVCHNTVIISISTLICSDAYSKMLRRKVGLNALETLPSLKKFSVTLEKVVFYVEV